MSIISPSTIPFQSIFRLVSPTVNVKTGTLSANAKFNTNIPLGMAAFIYEVEWGIALKDGPNAGSSSPSIFQITVELTENVVLTSASNTDALLIDDAFYEERYGTTEKTAAGELFETTYRNPFRENRRNFLQEFGGTYPSVAVQWNVIATLVNVIGSGLPTNGADVFANIWYTLAPVSGALQNYLTQRQQLQR